VTFFVSEETLATDTIEPVCSHADWHWFKSKAETQLWVLTLSGSNN